MVGRHAVNYDLGDIPSETTDYLVIGSGIAGLYSALKASKIGKVTLLTKRKLADSNTEHAQGGIAAAIDEEDSPALHYEDTMKAGAGLCDPKAVEILVNEGPERIRELLQMGANFDREGGNIALTREAAHSRRRILHAHGDATGGEIHNTLVREVRREELVHLREDHFVVDLLTSKGRCFGALAIDGTGRLTAYLAKVTILATGGAGRLFRSTTNPDVATGDGIAIAYRAGAELMDMEFMQFHPTALAIEGVPPFLVSEAVRGEGAYLRNQAGERFMPAHHKLAELAPRDVVARTINDEMAKTGTDRVYLDLSHLSPDKVHKRFPTIAATCAKFGLDITKDRIPVTPSAHYMMGGVRTNLYGETNLGGLYACGEAACQGVHGANRLASNSLLDGLVYGNRIVQKTVDLAREPLVPIDQAVMRCDALQPAESVDFSRLRQSIQEIMWDKVGIVRSAKSLREALGFFAQWQFLHNHLCQDVQSLEVVNMLTIGNLMAKAALLRTESRGGHYRDDFPEREDELWCRHIVLYQ